MNLKKEIMLPSSTILRPPMPFFLSSLKTKKIKTKQAPPLLFANIMKEKDQESLPVNERMRLLDNYRYHIPTEEERTLWRVPESIVRIRLYYREDILMVCGARRRARFTGLQLKNIAALATELQATFTTVEGVYKTVSKRALKKKDAESVSFHSAANDYVKIILTLKEEINTIRAANVKSSTADGAQTEEPLGDIEVNVKAKHPYPVYLMTLIKKYQDECGLTPMKSIAHLSTFLAKILTSQSPLTCEEYHALNTLLHILKCKHTSNALDSIHIVESGTSQRSLERQIWTFLSSVRELKSTVPKGRLEHEIRYPMNSVGTQ